MMVFSSTARGCSFVPSITGTFGPYTSASSKPTVAPSFFSAMARFTATVVLPTPPLPLATAMRFFTPSMGAFEALGPGDGGPGGIYILSGAQVTMTVRIDDRPRDGERQANGETVQRAAGCGIAV